MTNSLLSIIAKHHVCSLAEPCSWTKGIVEDLEKWIGNEVVGKDEYEPQYGLTTHVDGSFSTYNTPAGIRNILRYSLRNRLKQSVEGGK